MYTNTYFKHLFRSDGRSVGRAKFINETHAGLEITRFADFLSIGKNNIFVLPTRCVCRKHYDYRVYLSKKSGHEQRFRVDRCRARTIVLRRGAGTHVYCVQIESRDKLESIIDESSLMSAVNHVKYSVSTRCLSHRRCISQLPNYASYMTR